MMKKILIACFFFCSFLFLKTTLGQRNSKLHRYKRILYIREWKFKSKMGRPIGQMQEE